ncbi:uncharacterized protein LOC133206057 [Saccostrea echinata]|uniref:uncharacterized protein LOC133206057 n=1 Tax=Saccostrea echinata TaxID=191078 RepID=UPI002A82A1EC|nr:uncharacterized protein LOC133206057 [Saccostrea echinata]
MEIYVCLLFLSVCLSDMPVIADEGCCGKAQAGQCPKCCNNYYLVDGNCSECEPGFFGENCSDVCVYPYFGLKCLQECRCDKHLCDPVTGCHEESTTKGTTNTSVNLTEFGHKTDENVQWMTNFIDSSHLQIVFTVGGVALGFCILTIVLLVIMIIRRQQTSRDLDVEYHELQMLGHHKENLERKATPVEMNTYRSIRKVASKPRSSDNSSSHCYQDIQEYMSIDGNAEIRDTEKNDKGLCEYLKMEDPSMTDDGYQIPIVKEAMLSKN